MAGVWGNSGRPDSSGRGFGGEESQSRRRQVQQPRRAPGGGTRAAARPRGLRGGHGEQHGGPGGQAQQRPARVHLPGRQGETDPGERRCLGPVGREGDGRLGTLGPADCSGGSVRVGLAAAPSVAGGADWLLPPAVGPPRCQLLTGSRWSPAEDGTPSGRGLALGAAGGTPGASGLLSVCLDADLTPTLLFILTSRCGQSL